MKNLYQKFSATVSNWNDLPLLFFRIILVIAFFNPALMKLTGLQGTADWFGSMNFPVPFILALLVMLTEVLGVVLLALGLGTRIIAIPMMFVMFIAIITVHWGNGFAAADNGYEILLYYFLMLFALMVYGSGKYSVDYLLSKR
ncbi:MAG: DoxX family protein [Bacteroidales bacterium]